MVFAPAWLKPTASRKGFKSPEFFSLFVDYLKRIAPFAACETGRLSDLEAGPKSGRTVWVCEMGEGSLTLSSEQVAGRLEKLLSSGCKELWVVIGGADGLGREDLRQINPDLLWSLGPLTLPHELAVVVVAEQIYRAFTILRGLPYHLGH